MQLQNHKNVNIMSSYSTQRLREHQGRMVWISHCEQEKCSNENYEIFGSKYIVALEMTTHVQ